MLRQSKGKLLFKSEALLEEIVWLNLYQLLHLTPLQKQCVINAESRSDILGVNSQKRLAILELKKEGGRESIDQLTRYEKDIRNLEKFESKFSSVDFKQDFLLIAIASEFSNSAIDYARNKLPQCLLFTYEIEKTQNNEYFLILRNLDGKIYSKTAITIIEDTLFDSLPAFLQGYLIKNSQIRQQVLKLIEKIISYSSKISFYTQMNYSQEGFLKEIIFAKFDLNRETSDNKTCVRIIYKYSINPPDSKLTIFVYLPSIILGRSHKRTKQIDSIALETTDFIHIIDFWDCNKTMSKALGIQLRYELKTSGINEVYDNFPDYYTNYRKYMKSRKSLNPLTPSDFTFVESIVQMALDDWSVR